MSHIFDVSALLSITQNTCSSFSSSPVWGTFVRRFSNYSISTTSITIMRQVPHTFFHSHIRLCTQDKEVFFLSFCCLVTLLWYDLTTVWLLSRNCGLWTTITHHLVSVTLSIIVFVQQIEMLLGLFLPPLFASSQNEMTALHKDHGNNGHDNLSVFSESSLYQRLNFLKNFSWICLCFWDIIWDRPLQRIISHKCSSIH